METRGETLAPWRARAVWAAVGTVVALWLFGHQRVPNPDFSRFLLIGEALWGGAWPAEARRGPLVGLLHAGVDRLTGGASPLRAAWACNVVLLPCALVAFWELARRLTPTWCIPLTAWFALHPSLLGAYVQPLAELPLLTLTLASVLAMGRRSAWLWAGLASLVRLDGLWLIACATVARMKSGGRLIRSALLGCAVAVPAVAWSWGLRSRSGRRSAYWDELGVESGWAWTDWLRAIGDVAFWPLEAWWPGGDPTVHAVWGTIALGLATAGVLRRLPDAPCARWTASVAVASLGVLLVYHVTDRYVASSAWALGLLAARALEPARRSGLRWAGGVCVLMAGAWTLHWAWPRVGWWREVSPPVLAAGAIILAGSLVVALGTSRSARSRWRVAVLTGVVTCLSLPSLANGLRTGESASEFADLGGWFAEVSTPDDVLATARPRIVQLFAERAAGRLRSLPGTTSRLRHGPGAGVRDLDARSRGARWVAVPQLRLWEQRADPHPPPSATSDPYRFLRRFLGPEGASWIDVYQRIEAPTPGRPADGSAAPGPDVGERRRP